jgi:DNA topoisomerase-2
MDSQHILVRPDTYVGSIEAQTTEMFVINPETLKMEQRKVTYVPALYKIYDEIVVNAADNKQRDASMTFLKIEIDREKGKLSVMNDGKGIPVAMHKEHNVYVPELIFGHLLAGSNFNDDKKKTVGGRNGYGAKLANIFSTEFIVETADRCLALRIQPAFTDSRDQLACSGM